MCGIYSKFYHYGRIFTSKQACFRLTGLNVSEQQCTDGPPIVWYTLPAGSYTIEELSVTAPYVKSSEAINPSDKAAQLTLTKGFFARGLL